jgi:hypothetical protein
MMGVSGRRDKEEEAKKYGWDGRGNVELVKKY